MNYVLVDHIKKIDAAVKEARLVAAELDRRAGIASGVLQVRHHQAMLQIEEARDYLITLAERC